VRNKITSAAVRIMRSRETPRYRYCRHCKHTRSHSNKFLQILIYFILWLQRQIHMKHRC